MIPTSCASSRSMARWVLPVLVGPRTAVTPRPRTSPELEAEGRLILTNPKPTDSVSGPTRLSWNEGGTNLVRIADSAHSVFVLLSLHEVPVPLSSPVAEVVFTPLNQAVEVDAS